MYHSDTDAVQEAPPIHTANGLNLKFVVLVSQATSARISSPNRHKVARQLYNRDRKERWLAKFRVQLYPDLIPLQY